jgi:hypothetical protein
MQQVWVSPKMAFQIQKNSKKWKIKKGGLDFTPFPLMSQTWLETHERMLVIRFGRLKREHWTPTDGN